MSPRPATSPLPPGRGSERGETPGRGRPARTDDGGSRVGAAEPDVLDVALLGRSASTAPAFVAERSAGTSGPTAEATR